MSSNPQVIALDIGFGQVKAAIDGRQISFPSYTARVTHAAQTNGNAETYTDADGTWLVGQSAHRFSKAKAPTVDSTWYAEPEFRVLAGHAINMLGASGFAVVTGLPIRYYNRHATPFVEHVRNDWPKRGLTANIARVLPQPIGTFLHIATDERGGLKKEFAGRIAVIDIGAGTIDAVEINSGDISWDALSSEPYGVNRAFEHLQSHIRAKGVNLRMSDMPEIFRTGHYSRHGEQVAVAKPIEDAKQIVLQAVLDQAHELWGNMASVDTVLFTGGGAQFLRPELQSAFKKSKVFIPEHSESANASGYLKAYRILGPTTRAVG